MEKGKGESNSLFKSVNEYINFKIKIEISFKM